MRNSWFLLCSSALALGACGQSQNAEYYEVSADDSVAEADGTTERATNVDIEEPRPDTSLSSPDAIEPESAITAPQIAYRYALGFRLPVEAIAPLQERHADMCEARGPNVCRIISMRQSDSDGDYAFGNLQIAVAASVARDFGKELEESSSNSDAELFSSSIEGEDLSRQIVNTEARLRARTLLRDRLMEILRNRDGSVEELVEAERGVAQVNQEIDQARSWLNEMRGRVAFSQMAISYESGSPRSGGFSEPITNAWGSLGAILGTIIAFLMMAVTAILPIAVIGFGALWLWRWAQSKNPQYAEAEYEETSEDVA